MGTLVVGALVVAVVVLIIRGMVNDKKKGKSVIGCGGDCGKCGGHCH